MPPLIQAKDLTKTYGRGEGAFQALKGVDFTLEEGETVGIVGKSGSGKSTLMHLLALMDSPTSGSLKIEGKDTRDFSKRELDRVRNEFLGFVFQQFFLNARDSVLANVLLPLKIGRVGAKDRRARAMEALEAVGLADKAENRANDLSGGQKQRVVIARALVNEAAVILGDEVTGNLDSQTGQVVEDLFFSLNRERGTTLVLVTHDPELALKCQRQVHVKDGLIVSEEEAGK